MTLTPTTTDAGVDRQGSALPWGRHYLAVAPSHFRIDYVINPFMDPASQPDPRLARRQWERLVGVLRGLGARVDVLEQRSDSPDMVYAMNLGLAVSGAHSEPGGDGALVVMSHMRYAERRAETRSARPWFEAHGAVTTDTGDAPYEAGDAFAFGGDLVVGYGPRTSEAALAVLAANLDVRVRGLRIVHPAMYHFDLAFAPLDSRRAMVCPAALDPASAEALLDLVPEPLVLSESEALTFVANSVVVGRTVVAPACPPRVREVLEGWGFAVVLVDVGEFHKGGGSVRCLTNPLDLRLGRDLTVVPGGEVVLA